MQNTQIGHFAVDIDGEHFEFRPSLRNMAKLASAEDLLLIFKTMHNPAATTSTLIDCSHDILLACVDRPHQFEKFIAKINEKGKPHFKSRKAISVRDQIMVASGLIRHGIAGVNRPRTSLKSNGAPMKKFDVYRFVADAKQHFGVTLTEAWDMTMSEFHYHLAAAFPPTGDEPDLEKHEKEMSKYAEMYEKAMAARGDK